MNKFSPIVDGPSRRVDTYGSGQFGAARGGHKHQGLDISASPGTAIKAPISGIVTGESIPYANDPRYRGVAITGTGPWAGYTAKIFYVSGLFSGTVSAGQTVGYAQNLQNKYPGITNHVHLEVRYNNKIVNPSEMYGMCF